MTLVQTLDTENIDIIGDVHGEFDALLNLITILGYNRNGEHPENRKLVFVGDLVDRGPDSLSVVYLVEEWIQRGNAYAVLGNHELNLLIPDDDDPSRPSLKSGNHWFHGLEEDMISSKSERKQPNYKAIIQKQRLASAEDRERITRFLLSLPLALESKHCRIVHSCWHDESIDALRSESKPLMDLYTEYRSKILKMPNNDNLSLLKQNKNPIKIITSGLEEKLGPTEKPYVTGGKERFTKRSKWWKDYDGEQYVFFGHYWRTREAQKDLPEELLHLDDKKNIPPLFEEDTPYAWLNSKSKHPKCMCIDYSVGRRFWERHNSLNLGSTGTALAAARIRSTSNSLSISLVFDDGFQKDISPKTDFE